MADITLSAAVRDSLLSLQGTTDLINRTQSRLSSGLRVSSATDDPVAFFQSKSLTDRAADFTDKKEGIDQAVSTVSAALDGVTAVEAIVAQMKGIAQSLKSATGTQFTDLITQFNDLRDQINFLTTDTTYQGVNLVNGTGVTLDVEFSKLTASVLNISSVDITNGTRGLNVNGVANDTGGFNVYHAAGTVGSVFNQGETLTLTWQGVGKTYTSGDTISFTYGQNTLTINVGTADVTLANGTTLTINAFSSGATSANFYVNVGVPDTGGIYVSYAAGTNGSALSNTGAVGEITVTWEGADRTFTAGDTFTLSYGTANLTVVVGTATLTVSKGSTFAIDVLTAGSDVAAANDFYISTSGGAIAISTAGGEVAATTAAVIPSASIDVSTGGQVAAVAASTSTFVQEGSTAEINTIITNLDAALDTTRSQATSLGTNVSLLQTRLDFTTNYVTTLEEGSGKLTLADINEEGANLLALQTRQQLGINSLAFAGQAEQSILSLFR